MKTNDILLYGGLAAAAYFLFIKPKQTVIPVTTPGGAVIPVTASNAPANNATSNLLNTVNNIVKQLTSPGQNNVVSVQTPLTATGTNAVTTPLQTVNTPVVAPPADSSLIFVNTDDSLYKMFQNGDYPGALAGYIQEEMHS